MSAELKVEQLFKVFGTGHAAVNDVSFHVAAGEIVVLLGPRVRQDHDAALRRRPGAPTAGAISIGHDVVSAPASGTLVPPRLRNIGMVFQSYAVWPHMTVQQNVVYPLRSRKVSRAERKRKVGEALELVGPV
jgi:iron(III) transport system ATP-binding protein